MKYCQYCGAEIKDEARFCQNCGKQCRTDYETDYISSINYKDGVYYDTTPQTTKLAEKPTLAIVTLVLSILGFGLVGFICGIVTLAKYHTLKYRIMGIISMVISIIWTIVAISAIYSCLMAIAQNGGYTFG